MISEDTEENSQKPIGQSANQTDTQTLFTPSAYEQRIVAFLDILGWAGLIKESENDPALIAKMGGALGFLKMMAQIPGWLEEQARKTLEARGETYSPNPEILQYSQFSDCIVISGLVSLVGKISLLFEIDRILLSLFYNSHLVVRGGITVGPMYHKNAVAFGPALTEAYKLQVKAKYPRVIIDRKLMDETSESLFSFQRSSSFPAMRLAPDGWNFLDYLRPLIARPAIIDSAMLERFVKPNLNFARKFILDALQKYSDDIGTWDKYLWMLEYFNAVLSEYPESGIEPISFKLTHDPGVGEFGS